MDSTTPSVLAASASRAVQRYRSRNMHTQACVSVVRRGCFAVALRPLQNTHFAFSETLHSIMCACPGHHLLSLQSAPVCPGLHMHLGMTESRWRVHSPLPLHWRFESELDVAQAATGSNTTVDLCTPFGMNVCMPKIPSRVSFFCTASDLRVRACERASVRVCERVVPGDLLDFVCDSRAPAVQAQICKLHARCARTRRHTMHNGT